MIPSSRLSSRHRKTLEAIFIDPALSDIAWRDIEALLAALGAEISEGSGSRVRIALNQVRAVFHRPHPQKETNRATVRSVRRFLMEAGVKP
jgi:hypothetical protein